jgi:hypothetical protein
VQILRASQGSSVPANILMLKKVTSCVELIDQDENINLFYVFTAILATYQNSGEDNLYRISSPYGNDHKHFGI